jgi:uncharacterized membrane protein YhaH (DUF805 family)
VSTPQGQPNPSVPGPYPDPLPEYIPGQGGDRPPRSEEWGGQERAGGQPGQPGPAGGQQSAYSGYPPGSGYQQGGGYGPGGGYAAGGGYGPGGYGPGGNYGGSTVAPASYLQGAPVGFPDAVRGAFGHIFTYRGRASRSAFWWFALLEFIAYAVVGFISNRSTVAGVILDIIIGVPIVLAGISLAVRRLHDADHTGWWWWIGFVPLVGWIISLVFYVLPGTPGANRYNVMR